MLCPFEGCQISLQRVASGIAGTGVFEALVLTELLLDVGRGLEDRRHDGASGGIGLLARVDGAGRNVESEIVVGNVGHGCRVKAQRKLTTTPLFGR